jgi:hypothetical protein
MPNFSCPTCHARNSTDFVQHDPVTGRPSCSWCSLPLPAATLREVRELTSVPTGKK